MKKITAFLLALTLVTGLAACEKDKEKSESKNSSVESSESQAETTAAESEAEKETEATTEAPTEEATKADTDDTAVDKLPTQGEYHAAGETVEFDLNSDGKKEKITYTIVAEDEWIDNATLTVNDQTYEMPFAVDKYLICDIDPTDKYFEIGVSSYGPSADYMTDFLHYYNGKLVSVGAVADIPDNMSKWFRINGDGTVNAEKQLHIFQSWAACATYKLDTVKGKLIEIKDMYYPYGTELKDDFDTLYEKIYSERPASYTTKAINLYSEPNKNSKTVAFAAQEYIASATDDINWVYLIGKDGSKGWLYCDDRSIYDGNGDMVEYVDGNGFIDAVTGESLGDIFKEIFVYG